MLPRGRIPWYYLPTDQLIMPQQRDGDNFKINASASACIDRPVIAAIPVLPVSHYEPARQRLCFGRPFVVKHKGLRSSRLPNFSSRDLYGVATALVGGTCHTGHRMIAMLRSNPRKERKDQSPSIILFFGWKNSSNRAFLRLWIHRSKIV